MNKQEIIDYFKDACTQAHKKLSRIEFRALNGPYTSSLIENIWGSWTNFVKEAEFDVKRHDILISMDKNAKKVVITSIADGAMLHEDAFECLKNYCCKNDASLVILWGRGLKKNETLTEETYNKLSKYLATGVLFELDDKCIARDLLVPMTQKNPLLNIDKLTTHLNTVILSNSKQYLKILPYKQYDDFRVACTTGTIGEIEYKDTVAGAIDRKFHTLGGILLEYSENKKRYIPRNLVYNEGCIYDQNKIYTAKTVKANKSVEAMVCGDLHLPEEDMQALIHTEEQINQLNPKCVMIHDVASWTSISHHDAHQYLTKLRNRETINSTLEMELTQVVARLSKLANSHKDTQFKIVSSNHDVFIDKWLNAGEFIKDTANAKIGAELFIEYSQGHNILDKYLMKNVEILPRNSSFRVKGYELAEHGDSGICGAKGNSQVFSKGFERIIIGHTHSPEINQSTVVVGTLSKLKLSYNQQGMTNWAHCNAIIHENSTFQLLFI